MSASDLSAKNAKLEALLKSRDSVIIELTNAIAVLQNNVSSTKQLIDPRTGFHPLPNDATLSMEYGARAYVTDAYPGFIWRNGYWYKITPALKFSRLSDASIYSRLQKQDSNGPLNFTGSGGISSAVTFQTFMINDSFDALFVDEVRLFARRKVARSDADKSVTGIDVIPGVSVKEFCDHYHGFYIPATGNFQDSYSDTSHSDQITVEHSYISGKYFTDLDVDICTNWNLFCGTPGKSFVYQVDPYSSTRGRKIPITDLQKTEIQHRGLLYINDIVPQIRLT